VGHVLSPHGWFVRRGGQRCRPLCGLGNGDHVVAGGFSPANGLLLVTVKEARSQGELTRWKNRSATSASNGMWPTSPSVGSGKRPRRVKLGLEPRRGGRRGRPTLRRWRTVAGAHLPRVVRSR
jgi:hypothetical protein